jgi:multiple sugar transport system permease protein
MRKTITVRKGLARKYIIFILLVGPALFVRLATSVYPVFHTLYTSLFDYNLMNQIRQFIGFGNFIRIVGDPTTRSIIGFTVVFVVVSTIIQLCAGMGVAHLLNARFPGRRLIRTINLVPWAIPLIVSGYAFRWLLNGDYGLISDWIVRFGGERPHFLVEATSARITLIFVNAWRNTPFMGLVLLAGLQSIPDELYEAARMDGASGLQRFTHITMPASISTIVTLGLFNLIWQMSDIDLVLAVTQGGPGTATTVLPYRIYQNGMLWFDWGNASALSVLLILLVALVGILGLRLFRRYEFTL